MTNIWKKFRDTPRDRVDGFVNEIACQAVKTQDDLLAFAIKADPHLSSDEITALAEMGMDMVAPPDPEVSFGNWMASWNDGLYFALRACGARAKDALTAVVLKPGRNSARVMFFDCLVAAMDADGAEKPEYEALGRGLQVLDTLELFETSTVKDWVRCLMQVDAERALPLLNALKECWFIDGFGEDAHDDDHTVYEWASSVLFVTIWVPSYRPIFSDILEKIARADYFVVPIDVHDLDDAPVEGAPRVEKIGCMQGAAVVLLEIDPDRADLIALCRAYADSPAEDTRQAWAQWLPIAERQLPCAFAVLS